MKKKPTTFQLAQLAAQGARPNSRPKDAVRRAMELWKESELEIAESEKRADFLRRLFHTPDGKDIPIFTDTPEEWRTRLEAYPGDPRDVDSALWKQTFPAEVVARNLFRDRTLSKETRAKFLVGLARACIRYDVEGPMIAYAGRPSYLDGGEFVAPVPGFPIHPKNLERAESNHRGLGPMWIPSGEVRFVKKVEELLSAPNLNAHLVRWAVEVRRRQLAESKARIIPQSLRRRRHERGRDDSL